MVSVFYSLLIYADIILHYLIFVILLHISYTCILMDFGVSSPYPYSMLQHRSFSCLGTSMDILSPLL